MKHWDLDAANAANGRKLLKVTDLRLEQVNVCLFRLTESSSNYRVVPLAFTIRYRFVTFESVTDICERRKHGCGRRGGGRGPGPGCREGP
jgi:hypothetical protein